MRKGIALLLVGLLTIGFSVVSLSAQEEEPEPDFSLDKSATSDADLGEFAGYDIVAENSGEEGAEYELRDQLPAGYDWFIWETDAFGSLGSTIDCSITDDGDATLLLYCSGWLDSRGLVEQEDGQVLFVNGSTEVQVRAYMHEECVNLFNRAELLGGGEANSDSAVLAVTCPPTPTPTATSTPTPPNTPQPTSTPAPTQTPVIVTATPTATVNTGTLKPPSTGNGVEEDSSPLLSYLLLAFGGAATVFGAGGIVVARRG